MTNLYIKDKVFCTIMTLKQLQFNILDHSLVPLHRILSESEVATIKENYNIIQDSQFPEISRFDPVAKAIGMRPGEVCEIIRGSKTAITTKYYRLCY
jgi:DNA-directed RNA polymerase subunit H